MPELVKGGSLRPRRIGSRELDQIEASGQNLLGVWRTAGKGKLSPLPQLILGRSSALEDLVAWTATYVPGLSPLSSLIRLMTPQTFRYCISRAGVKDWERLAGAAVGLMYGEVMSYANLTIDIGAIDRELCRSTLSYVLMRNIALGGNEKDVVAIAEDWLTLRQHAGLSTKKDSCKLIADIAKEWMRSEWEMSLFDSKGWPIFHRDNDLLGELKSLGGFQGGDKNVIGSLKETNLTAEQRVRIFDELAPRLISDSTCGSRDRGMNLALLAFWCRKGLSNQWAILQPFQAQVPECAIWLGALQAREPMADTLFVGRAVGWRLAMELFEEMDLFGVPDEDISSFELGVGQAERQWNHFVSGISKARIKVAMAPGVSTYLKIGGRNEMVQGELPISVSYHGERKENLRKVKELRLLQNSLEMTLREIRRYLRMQE